MSASEIQTNSQKPKRATVDGNSAEQHPISDQILAERFAASETAKASKGPGIRFMQLRNQGTA